MLKTSKLLTITVPKPFLRKIRFESKRRDTSISELLRNAFDFYTEDIPEVYSDKEIASLVKRDELSRKFRTQLDSLLKK